ncbi:MAG TPA: hypothetical protein VNT29_05835, partial [Candidatus Limnocylindrales bacterium]|nr:hypothetical protein [Candidatus Limnocylindrales bacterium]
RHAAAFALVGWYMMVPPPALFDEAHRGSLAHLSMWEVRGGYASAADCEKAMTKAKSEMLRKLQDDLDTAARTDANLADRASYPYEAVRLARCVSADDTHIKGRLVRLHPAN